MDIEARQRGLVASGRAAAQAFQASLARPEPVTTPVVECIESATVCPENHAFRNDAGVLVQDGGVYYPDGRLCELSVHRACNRLHANVPLPLASSVASREVTGTHLFGGVLIGHFGHFLLESLSRLWALDEYGTQIESVVFVKSWGLHNVGSTAEVHLPPYVRDTLALLGIPKIMVVHGVPVRFERLIVPSQLLGIHLIEGHAAFHRFVKRLGAVGLPSSVLSNGCRDVYISRRKICDAGWAGILCENVIEENLRGYGYQIIYPEGLTVEEQLGIYNQSERIVFATSSAIHLFALVAREDQRAFTINRKPGGATLHLEQVRGFGCFQVEQFDGITERLFRRSTSTWMAAENTSVAVLDFDLLGSALEARGFLPDTAQWRPPTAEELREQLNVIDPVKDSH